MPAVRARVDHVLARVRMDLTAEARAAAGRGGVLSREEARAMPSQLLRRAVDEIRDREFGARVAASEAAERALTEVASGISSINQAAGAGKTFLSAEEIKRLQGVNSETAQRAARAYELITGKRVVLDGTVPAQPASALPQRAVVALTDSLVDYHGLARAARVTTKDVRAVDGGFAFKVETNVFSGEAFAREVDGRFVVAGKPFSAAHYAAVKAAALDFFDTSFAHDMREWGASEREIADARARFVPVRGFLAGESDPHDYASSYPVVFQIDNETGSDHGVYAGFDPTTGDVDVYAFN